MGLLCAAAAAAHWAVDQEAAAAVSEMKTIISRRRVNSDVQMCSAVPLCNVRAEKKHTEESGYQK